MRNITRLLLIFFLLTAPLINVSRAAAQEEGTLVISTPETEAFPEIRFQLDAYDAQGKAIDLKPGDVKIIEDGRTVTPLAVEKIQTGLQTIIAINTSPVLANQTEGVSEFQRLQQGLLEWAQVQAAATRRTPDEFSLAAPSGLILTREEDPELLVKAINEYQPNLLETPPALGSLAEALDLATDPLNQPFMKRSILYITPPLVDTNATTLEDLTNRAKGIGVRVNVWKLMANGAPVEGYIDPLRQLAEATGGQYQDVLPSGPLPQIEPLFQPLRQTYQVTYTTEMKTSGVHSLSVQVSQGDTRLTAPETSFSFTLNPPNPIFLSPPASVQRSWSAPEQDAAPTLTPDQVPLQILIEFPDGHERELETTRLYVNDELLAENTSPPFDQFTWSISELTTSSRHTLRVEAVDTLGLSGTSIDVPVEVLVDQPAKTSIVDCISSQGLIAVGAMTSAGTALVIVMVLTGNRRRSRRKNQLADKKQLTDPVTQPVLIQQDPARQKKAPSPVTAWSGAMWSRTNGLNAPARLVVLDENEQPITGGAIPLARQEITFGTDPRRATQVLDSPTVEGLHARLYRTEEGQYILADQNSIAGTWINYAPVTNGGARLEHGDLIHIGKIMLRFEVTEPSRIPAVEIKVIDLEKPV